MKSYAIIERATGCVVKITPEIDGKKPPIPTGHFAEEINWPVITEGWHFDRRKKRFLSPLHEDADLLQRKRAHG